MVITCHHAELGKSFFEFDFPAIDQLIKLSKNDFNNFLEIEYDFVLTHLVMQ